MMESNLRGTRIAVWMIVAFWLGWVWLYNFLLGGEALWKCIVLTALVPLPLAAGVLILEVRRRLRHG